MRKVSQGGRDDADADVRDDDADTDVGDDDADADADVRGDDADADVGDDDADAAVGVDDEYVRDEEKDQAGLMLFHYVTFLCFDVPLDGPSVWTLSSK